MKITVTQGEIEQAIRAQIASTIQLPEGAELELQVEDGEFLAVIDLNPSDEKKDAAPKARRQYTRRSAAGGEPAAAASAPVTGQDQQPAGAAQEPAQEPAGEASVTTVVADASPAQEPAQQATGTDGGGAAPEGEPKKSLFGGLNRPTNS